MSVEDTSECVVRIDAELLERSAYGNIVGPIWIELEGSAFPQANWTDFPLSLLTEWTSLALELESDRPADWLRFDFLDGNYAFLMRSRAIRVWQVRLLTGSNDHCLRDASISEDAFVESLLKASNLLIHSIRRRSWTHPECEVLVRRVQELASRSRSR